MGSLDGKVAVVTGAGRGIGRGEALALAREGATVVVNDVDPADDVVDAITASGGKAVANRDDVATWAGAESLVLQAVDDFGRLDVLVNNAGVLRDAMSFNMDEDDWDTVIAVHLKGHMATSRFAAAHWRDRSKAGDESGGCIVNTTSEAGLYGGTGQANYVAAKAGIAALTVGLARELKKYGVRANAIAPRARTRMTEAVLGDFAAPRGDFDEWDPDNIGPVVAWLAGPGAADVTGQVFVVFGGRVHLMHGWDLVGEVEQDHQWTVDELTARGAELFGEHRPGLPKIGFGR